jgi:hypothetical protein
MNQYEYSMTITQVFEAKNLAEAKKWARRAESQVDIHLQLTLLNDAVTTTAVKKVKSKPSGVDTLG